MSHFALHKISQFMIFHPEDLHNLLERKKTT
jgi:hypothetical protein